MTTGETEVVIFTRAALAAPSLSVSWSCQVVKQPGRLTLGSGNASASLPRVSARRLSPVSLASQSEPSNEP